MILRLLTVCLLLLLTACPDTDTGATSTPANDDAGSRDAGVDAADVAGEPDAGPDAAPNTGPDCVCATVDDCCDGCQPRAVGEVCDDGSECSLETTCQPDGTCGGATGSPCDELVEHPQCQAASCDDVAGCAFEDVREGLPCEAEGIRDGRCEAGQCVGTVCTCDGESECCDGCLPVNEGGACDDGDDGTGADVCQAGACVGEPCTCSEGDCCDGCLPLPRDTVCGERVGDDENICDPQDENIIIYREHMRACDGTSGECGNHTTPVDQRYECQGGRTCQIVNGWHTCTY